jgi:uncharacterized protein (TIGR00156 family)
LAVKEDYPPKVDVCSITEYYIKRGILMKKYPFFGILSLMILFSAAIVHSQGFDGPGSNNSRPNNNPNNRQPQPITVSQPITVNEAKALPNGSWVILTGTIASTRSGGETYTFRDSTGEVMVEIKRNVWRGLTVSTGDRVEIGGEVEINRGRVLIEAKFITRAGTVTQPVTISEAESLPNNSWVVFTGNIINALRSETYTFHDSTGELIVKIERKVWRGLSIGVSDRVEISGILEIQRGRISFEVKAIRKI